MKNKNIISSFIIGKRAKSNNCESTGKSLFLHGRRIADRIEKDGTVEFSVFIGGWPTHTQVKTLNCLPGIKIHTSNNNLFLNDMWWTGDRTTVEKWKIFLQSFLSH